MKRGPRGERESKFLGQLFLLPEEIFHAPVGKPSPRRGTVCILLDRDPNEFSFFTLLLCETFCHSHSQQCTSLAADHTALSASC